MNLQSNCIPSASLYLENASLLDLGNEGTRTKQIQFITRRREKPNSWTARLEHPGSEKFPIMSLLQASRDIPVASTIPPHIPTSSVLAKLHDHEFMIRLSPTVLDCELIAMQDETILRNEPDYTTWFKITEAVPVVGRTSFFGGFKDQPDGLDSVFYAPAGLIMHLSARVVESDANGHQTRILREENNLRGNRLLMPFIAWQFTRLHRENQARLFERISQAPGDIY